MNLFGPGERFVNDGEAKIMEIGRLISRELNCAVRYSHHVSKEAARGRFVDAHTGRGGAAGGDNARFVWVVVPHDIRGREALSHARWCLARSRRARRALPAALPEDHGRATDTRPGLDRARRVHLPPHRRGRARRLRRRKRQTLVVCRTSSQPRLAAESSTLATRSKAPSARLVCPGQQLRRALVVGEHQGRLVQMPLPENERRGGRTHYYTPATPAR